ncbi:MFS transporter [Conexibacter sp. SYSU D00693]|uniref:MFS transporter n=1 Tax=Conexibacter sp. SYSU D00693 TaxID=2812560 RepID=UPI00196AC2E8|nr:MFS transporter [Conexibacter sp. SYSU D00693]
MPELRHRHGFWAVAFAFLVVMAYSAVPTPLYAIYAARDGFGSLTVTIVFAAYAAGVLASLFLVGHLSDVHGRRRLLAPALLVSAASAVVFLVWRDVPGLLVARAVSGLGVGAVTATATAWLAELHRAARPDAPPRRAEVVAIAANLGGIGLGPLVSGVLAQWVTSPLTVPYLVFLALLLLAVALVWRTPETRTAHAARPAYRPQRVVVPAAARPAFFGASGGALLGFAAFGLFTSLAPTFLAGELGHPSRALAGLAAFVVFAASAASQVVLASRGERDLVAMGGGAMVLGAAALVLALWLPSPSLALFLAGGVVLGGGAGSLFKGAVITVAKIADDDHRAEALAGLFLAGYLGLVVPVVGLGLLTQELEPRVALLVFAGILVAGVLASVRPLLTRAAAPAPAPLAA